jgi:hypothetical protein
VSTRHFGHLCLPCHPPTERTTRRTANPEGLVASIPSPKQPLKSVPYYSGLSDRVRGDIGYLRQILAVVQVVDDHAPWPAEQRFDYVVRTRAATDEEIARAQAAGARPTGKPEQASYRHGESVLFALTQLRSAATSIATR